jgi:integrase
MAGNVYRHGNGWKAVIVDGYGRGAKRRSLGTFRRKGDALDELHKAESELLRGALVDRQAGKVSLVERMRADLERRSDLATNTTIVRANAIGHVEAWFGSKPINAVRHSDVQAFVSGLDLAPSTVRTVFNALKASIRLAIADGVVGRDCTLKIKLPRATPTDMVIPTDVEVERLHAHAPAGFGAAVILGAAVGLRSQETAGLLGDDIDWLTQTVNVRRQWHGRSGEFTDLKGRMVRAVPVGDDIVEALAHHVGVHGLGEHGVVVHDGDGAPLQASRFRPRWVRTRTAAGLDGLHFHSLRHHYSSTAIAAGVSLPRLSKALGHAKPSFTLDVYGHLIVDDDDRLRSATTARFGKRATA